MLNSYTVSVLELSRPIRLLVSILSSIDVLILLTVFYMRCMDICLSIRITETLKLEILEMLLPIRVVPREFEQNAFTDFPTKTVVFSSSFNARAVIVQVLLGN